ncbi:hypothetical protein SLEP1_g22659 [Rubroshorea leprosula]|uniref:Uncharacterized protein n=1 Tax=Rubroshorea leprosula TaxID=152421 RepID=A0AAV5JKA8_9ROSI|nr:hypothetical protein SLEP1_g22659 [Rubroshorea leprosula]
MISSKLCAFVRLSHKCTASVAPLIRVLGCDSNFDLSTYINISK